MHMLLLYDAQNPASISIRLPAGLTSSMFLEPTLMISPNDRNRPLAHSGVLGLDVFVQQVESDHLRTQRTDALGKEDQLRASLLVRLARLWVRILAMRAAKCSLPKAATIICRCARSEPLGLSWYSRTSGNEGILVVMQT